MNKYRILEKDDLFYPQWRFCFMWFNFILQGRSRYYGSLQLAKWFLDEKFIETPKPIIHKYP